ncbi:MAG: hypothetical protein AAFV95_10920 [Bacteroidota bacterium]
MHERWLVRKLQQASFQRGSVQFKQARSIGIAYLASNLTQTDHIRGFVRQLRKEDKEVKVLAFFPDKLEHNACPHKYFTKKSLDWMMRPKDFDTEQFMKTPFDVLINLSLVDCLPLEYVFALSKAGFRVGPLSPKLYCYDLMIDTSDDQMPNFIQQVAFFLNRMSNYETSTV